MESPSRTNEPGRRMYALCVLLALVLACRPEKPEFEGAIAELRAAGLDQVAAPESGLPYYTRGKLDPVWDAAHPQLARVPDFQFTSDQARTISARQLDGRVTVTCFFFTRCGGYCPKIMRNMQRVRRAFANDPEVYLLSHSVTPDLDSPAALRAYRESTGFSEEGWDLVTGDKTELYSLAREVYNADTNAAGLANKDQRADFIHSEHIYILDGQRRIRGIYNGNVDGDIAKIIADVRKLKQSGAHS